MSELKRYTVSEIAEMRGVSERAIYKQIKTHSKELEGHIEKIKGKQWLDEYAVKLLEEASSNSAPVVVEDASKRELEELRAELEKIKAEREAENKQFRELAMNMGKLVEEHNKNATLIAESKLYIEQRDNIQKELDEMKLKYEEVEHEVESFKKTWFGLYRKE